ncbi:hypothetical protein, partial [Xanthomonas vasicola]|uniref:hypothetical protein n=1 Tax=Xanthomonas vasicola TaxID=56459 RepID=UPI001C83822A
RFGFAQEADDLLFGKTLLHVQSPWGRELDSKLRCYSKLGGRRKASIQVRSGSLVPSNIVPAIRLV